MVEKEKINNISYSKDDVDIKKNIIGKGNENDPIFNKSKTYRNSVKTKTKRGNKKNIKEEKNKINNIKKVKFNSSVDVIKVECWKKYNLEQTADENLESIFLDYEEKDKDNTINNKKGKDSISCTCYII